ELPDRLPLDPRWAIPERRVVVGGDPMRARVEGEDVRIRDDVVVDEEQDWVSRLPGAAVPPLCSRAETLGLEQPQRERKLERTRHLEAAVGAAVEDDDGLEAVGGIRLRRERSQHLTEHLFFF